MSEDFTVDVAGMEADLNRALQNMHGVPVLDYLEVVGADAETIIKERYVPVDTGILRNSIHHYVTPDGLEVGSYELAYNVEQEFDETLNHDTPDNDTGERGAHYIKRGMEKATEPARLVDKAQRMHREIWGR